MSGIIFEEDEDDGVAELERILEESGEDEEDEVEEDVEEGEEEDDEQEEDAGVTRLSRPQTAVPFPLTGRRRSIHWNDESQALSSSNTTSSPASSRASSPGPGPGRPNASRSGSGSAGSPRGSPSAPGSPARSRSAAAAAATPASALSAVTSFRRSLKLLGLQPRELGLPEQPAPCPQGGLHAGRQGDRRSRSPGPTFTTRLRSRSVSLDDLRAAAKQQGALTPDKDGGVYRMISSAVYEEWYFRKEQELVERRRREQEQERRNLEEMERRKAEMQRKSQDKFQEWLRQKTHQLKSKSKDSSGTGAGPRHGQALRATHSHSMQRLVTPERAERAFQEWKRAKEEQRVKGGGAAGDQAKGGAGGRLPAKHARPGPDERREDADKAYAMWRSKIKEQEKEEAEKKRRVEEKRRLETDRKEKERKEMNLKSFERWKEEKEQQIKKTEERARRKEVRLEAAEQEKRQQRQYEAQQAFLVWLDDVEDREAAAQAQQRAQQLHRASPATVNGPSFRPARRHSCSE